MLLYSFDVTTSGAHRIEIHSPDTDVLVIAIRRFPNICTKIIFDTGKGLGKKYIDLQRAYFVLFHDICNALPGFYALAGADITGSFSGKGKVSCWKALQNSGKEILSTFSNLGKNEMPDEKIFNDLEKFICLLYSPNTHINNA